MYEDIYNQIKLAAEKKNLKPSTANAYCHTIRHFLDYTGKPWNELIIDDADAFLTAKRLSGVMPETYNHYYSAISAMKKTGFHTVRKPLTVHSLLFITLVSTYTELLSVIAVLSAWMKTLSHTM